MGKDSLNTTLVVSVTENILSLSSVSAFLQSCALAFSPTSSSDEGSYAVQLMMEDFAAQTITVTAGNGVQEVKNPGEVFSKIPVQFVFKGSY